MENKRTPIILIVIIIFLSYFSYKSYSKKAKDTMMKDPIIEVDEKSNDKAPVEISNSQKGAGEQTENFVLSDIFRDYSEVEVSNALAEGKKVVLFFSADWCSTCRAAKSDLAKNFNDLPNDLLILDVDYDSEKDLKQKYNIVTQHTFVQIDVNQEQITTWNGGGVDTIINNIE